MNFNKFVACFKDTPRDLPTLGLFADINRNLYDAWIWTVLRNRRGTTIENNSWHMLVYNSIHSKRRYLCRRIFFIQIPRPANMLQITILFEMHNINIPYSSITARCVLSDND
jgi:hypothetical protein